MEFIYDQSVTRKDALDLMCAHWQIMPQTCLVPLHQAYGRVTAAEVRATHSLPLVRSSKRDGIAVRSADFVAGLPDTHDWVRGRDFAQADTGDDFPDEFDAVIAVEDLTYDAEGVLSIINESLQIRPGTAVNPCGSIVREGALIVDAHTRLTPELVATLAVGGIAQVEVLAQPVVAYIPTGSELIPHGSYPRRGQNIEANSLLISGMLEQWGAQVVCYPIIRDDQAMIEQSLDRALEIADIVLINGGSSRGEEDYNSQLLEQRGTFFRHGVRAIPGRPIGMAIIEGKPVINVPGPVSAAFLTMDWLVRGLIAHYSKTPIPRRQIVSAQMASSLSKMSGFERLARVTLSSDGHGGYVCNQLPSSIGTPETFRITDAMLTVPLDCEEIPAGSMVDVELLRPLELIEASWNICTEER